MRRVFVTLGLAVGLTFAGGTVAAQTVVEMDLATAAQILQANRAQRALPMLAELSNNYKKYTNVRIISHERSEELAALADILRRDLDGSGRDYVPEVNVWRVDGQNGGFIFLAASQFDPGAVLLSTDLDYLKGMLAWEMLARIRTGTLGIEEARRRALALAIEMQVIEKEDGERSISFFGRTGTHSQLTGKLMVIEPPEMVWK